MYKNFILYIVAPLFITTFVSCAIKKQVQDKTEVLPNQKYDITVKNIWADVDNLGRIYVIDQKNQIITYDDMMKEKYRYADRKSGNISSVDISNPLKIVVFYNDFNKVKILDNTLSLISDLDLSDKFADVTACATTNDGNLWIFDPTQFKLIKIRDNGTKVIESSNVNDFDMTNVNISEIREKGNHVILVDKEKGFYIFDNYGQYRYHFEAKDIQYFNFDGQNINYYTATGLKRYSLKFKERILISSPVDISKQGTKYVILTGNDYYEVNADGINLVKKGVTEN